MTTQHFYGSTYGHLELRQAVGDHFFVWSHLEQAIKEQIKALETTSSNTRTRGISASLKHFKKLHLDAAKGRTKHILVVNEVVQFLSDALTIRNLIAHGLRGWRGNIDHDAAILLLELDEKRKELTLGSLRTTTGKLNTIAFNLGRLTYAAVHQDKIAIDNIYVEITGILTTKRYDIS